MHGQAGICCRLLQLTSALQSSAIHGHAAGTISQAQEPASFAAGDAGRFGFGGGSPTLARCRLDNTQHSSVDAAEKVERINT